MTSLDMPKYASFRSKNEAKEIFLKYKVKVETNWTKKSRDLESIGVKNKRLTLWESCEKNGIIH